MTTTGRLLKWGNPSLIRNVLRRFQLIREIVARKDVVMERVPSEDNITDPLTKSLSRIAIECHKDLIEIRYIGD